MGLPLRVSSFLVAFSDDTHFKTISDFVTIFYTLKKNPLLLRHIALQFEIPLLRINKKGTYVSFLARKDFFSKSVFVIISKSDKTTVLTKYEEKKRKKKRLIKQNDSLRN